jgi:hypothetical protein
LCRYVLDYDELVEKHSHPLDPAEAPLPPPMSGVVGPPRSPHALGAVPPGERSRLAMIRPATSGGETGPRPATGAAGLGESGSIGSFYAATGAGAAAAAGGTASTLHRGAGVGGMGVDGLGNVGLGSGGALHVESS